MRIIPKILLAVTLTVPMAGCIQSYRLVKHLTKPKVEYADASAFRCEETHIPDGRSYDTTGRIGMTPQESLDAYRARKPYLTVPDPSQGRIGQ